MDRLAFVREAGQSYNATSVAKHSSRQIIYTGMSEAIPKNDRFIVNRAISILAGSKTHLQPLP